MSQKHLSLVLIKQKKVSISKLADDFTVLCSSQCCLKINILTATEGVPLISAPYNLIILIAFSLLTKNVKKIVDVLTK